MTTNHLGNRLLNCLPKDELVPLLASARTVSLTRGQELYRQGGPVPHLYFPTTAALNKVILMESGEQVEGTSVGREGFVGLSAYLGLGFNPFSVSVQLPGEAMRVPTERLLGLAKPHSALDQILRRYTAYRLRYAKQTGACNTLHAAEERMARWLLVAHDRAGTDEFSLTHEYLAELLGVRRQTVSVIAGTLQEAGLIGYRRGILRIKDRKRLEAASCECYAVLRQQYNRIVQC